MDKEKIGKFLRSLREEKKLTQVDLSRKFNGVYSDAAISKWETGKAIPCVQDLQMLAKFFDVSIDEILNGAREIKENFKQKYFISDNNWTDRYKFDELYDVREAQELLIETRFKELLKKMVGDGLNVSEDAEFDFIINHFYKIFLPAVDCKDDEEYRQGWCEKCEWAEDIDFVHHNVLPGGLNDIKFEIYRQSALMHKSSIAEKFWEANKKFVFIAHQDIWRDFNNIIEVDENKVRARVMALEDYEKDILLAQIQTTNVINTYGKTNIYEKKYKRKYDEEIITKQAIRLLIECGAKLNNKILGYWEIKNVKYNVVNELSLLQKKYKSPLLIPIFENGEYHYFAVKNTIKNREKLCIKYDNENFNESDFSLLEEKLYNGNVKILRPYKFWTCGADGKVTYVHAKTQILNLSLEDYMRARDSEKTKELLNNLDNLSLEEIRVKYFPAEYRGEYIDDVDRLSEEELKAKYYLREANNE